MKNWYCRYYISGEWSNTWHIVHGKTREEALHTFMKGTKFSAAECDVTLTRPNHPDYKIYGWLYPETETVSVAPELMGRIINIQMMKEKINPNYDKIADFKILEHKTGDELWECQQELIPLYNESLKSKR